MRAAGEQDDAVRVAVAKRRREIELPLEVADAHAVVRVEEHAPPRSRRPRDRYSLPLTAGERCTALAKDRVEPVRELTNQTGEPCSFSSPLHLFVRRLRTSVANVFGDREPEQDRLLLHQGHLLANRLKL